MGTACSKGSKRKSKETVKTVSVKRRDDDDPSRPKYTRPATDDHLRHEDVTDVSHAELHSQPLHQATGEDSPNDANRPSSTGDVVVKDRCAASDDSDDDDDDVDDDDDDDHDDHEDNSSSEESDDVDSPPVSGDEQEQEEDNAPSPAKRNVEAYKSSDERVGLACKGRFDFEMPENIKIVRIFTSSTFTGTIHTF